MFKDAKAFPSFSTNNVDEAKKFYGETLGIKVSDDNMGGLNLHFAGMQVFVYPKDNHVPATFTVLNILVDDIAKSVSELTTKGIKFEHYDQEMLKTDERGISDMGDKGPKMAWFKDPAGNFLSLIQQ